MTLQPPRSNVWSRLATATLLWFAVVLLGANGRPWMGLDGAASISAVCAKSGPVASASAVTPRAELSNTAACCDDGDCLPGQCPSPCRGKCVCLGMHATPFSTTASLTLSGVVAFTLAPMSHAELAPLVVSREPALRPPIA